MYDIMIIPVSTGNSVTVAAMEGFCSAAFAFAQTLEHSFMEGLTDRRPDCVSMDDIYKSAESFDALNRAIAERLLTACINGNVAYAVLGEAGQALLNAIGAHPLRGDAGRLILLPSTGLARAAADVAVTHGRLGAYSGLVSYPANSLVVNNTTCLLGVTEINSRLVAGEVKLKLLEYYPAEFQVVLAAPNGTDYSTDTIPLYMLDRQESYDAATVALVPAASETELSRHSAEGLMEIMRRLRAPGGCPWDAEQTHESLRKNLIEESYEAIDAIDRLDTEGICEELGDLLLQIAFHAVIEEERENFNFRDISTGIVNKLIYRHPHVFGNTQVNNSDEVLKNWELLKRKEKRQATVSDAMEAVPRGFPALLRAYKIQKKAADVGFDWENAQLALDKAYEEAGEVRAAIESGDRAQVEEELGDLLFSVVNVARLMKIEPELCLSAATVKFENRFRLMESLLLSDGKRFEETTLAQMDEYWDRVKKSDR